MIVAIPNRFFRLEINDWRQFGSVEIGLHPRTTIITGANGSGKSTLLNIFAQHFGGPVRPMINTPRKEKTSGTTIYDPGVSRLLQGWLFEDDDLNEAPVDPYKAQSPPERVQINVGEFIQIGTLTYTNGTRAPVGFGNHPHVQQYGLQVQNQQPVPGVAISSHQGLYAFQPLQGLQFQAAQPAAAYQALINEQVARLSGGHTGYSPSYRVKETIASMAAFGEGNSSIERQPAIFDSFKKFVSNLAEMLPEEVGFRNLVVRGPDIVLQTQLGDFVLDAASGGVNAILEATWQIHLYSMAWDSFTVTLDEPENHLHPSMQRSLIPNLLKTFPNVQFIVATHSPFIVSSVEDSNVFVLRPDEAGTPDGAAFEAGRRRRKISSVMLDQIHKAGSASEILREVLGVPVTIPQWAQEKLDNIVTRFRKLPFSNETLNALRSELVESGLAELYTEALGKLVPDVDQAP